MATKKSTAPSVFKRVSIPKALLAPAQIDQDGVDVTPVGESGSKESRVSLTCRGRKPMLHKVQPNLTISIGICCSLVGFWQTLRQKQAKP